MESDFGKEISTKTPHDNDVSKIADTDSEGVNTHSSRQLENGDAGPFGMINDNVIDINGKMGLDEFTSEASNYRSLTDVYYDSSSSSDSDSDFEDSSSSCSSVSSEKNNDTDEVAVKKVHVPRTKGELSLKDLPKVEALTISVPESELKALGKISSMVEEILVVESFKNSPALDMDSVLFLSDGKAVGSVFETWGPVVEPHYSIRFNSVEELKARGFALGDTIYFAPENKTVTLYVFLESLRKQKGSDASGVDNNEPPIELLEYSDDEEEGKAKHKLKAKSRPAPSMGEVPKKRAVEANNAPFQPKPINISQNQHSNVNFQNRVPQIPGTFLRMVQPPINPANFMFGVNFNPRVHPLAYVQQPRFQVPPHPPMYGWQASKIGPQAVAFQMPNHQMRPPFNAPVQNNIINVPGMTSQPLNSVSSAHLAVSSTSALSNSVSHQGPQLMNSSDLPQTSNASTYPATSSAGIGTNTPLLYHPGKFTTPLSVNVPIVSPPLLPHPTTNNIPSVPTMSFNSFPPRIPNGTAYIPTSNPSFLHLNSNAHNTASLPLHQHPGINSAVSQINMNRGNVPVVPLQTVPPQTFVTASSASIRSVHPGLQYHIQGTVSSSITTNVSAVPRIPGMIPPPNLREPPPVLPTSVPVRGWHPFQQPMIGMLPNGVRGNVFSVPAPNNVPSALSRALPATPGDAPDQPRTLLPTPYFNPNGSPKSDSP